MQAQSTERPHNGRLAFSLIKRHYIKYITMGDNETQTPPPR